MTLFSLSQSRNVENFNRFDLLSAVLLALKSLPAPQQSLAFVLFSYMNKYPGHRSVWGSSHHRSIVVAPHQLAEALACRTDEVCELFGGFRANVPHLPLRFGRTVGSEDLGHALFDILAVHDTSGEELQKSWWLRPGIWMEAHLAKPARPFFFQALSSLAPSPISKAAQLAALCSLALAQAREAGWLRPGETAAVSYLMKSVVSKVDPWLLPDGSSDAVQALDEDLLFEALDLLLVGDVISCHSKDENGVVWLTVGETL